MKKYTNFNEIPQQTQRGSWECHYSLKDLVRAIDQWENDKDEDYRLDINPDFQRGHVWDTERQVLYIEALLSGGAKNARTIYLNMPSWNGKERSEYDEFVCVDGLQRLTAIKRFIKNEIKAFDSYYKEYIGSIRMLSAMKVNVNDLQTRKEVLQWYIEVNEGGVVHTKEEIDIVKNMIEEG